VNLGINRTAQQISAANNHTCALLDNDTIKCWGANTSGQLGQGDTNARGDGGGEMGNALAGVPLGTGFIPSAVRVGYTHTCAISTAATVKCWGANSSGQLGLGDTSARGDGPNEMGDNLASVSLGTGAFGIPRTAADLVASDVHTCALLDDATVKCWGNASQGQLGLGNINNRGDQAGEMGNSLPAVDLTGL
jgi:alpha-tubulin suppressor-like RCC1 family protein